MNEIIQAYCPAEHDRELIFEIGRITAKHALLEYVLTDLITYILSLKSSQGEAISAHLNIKTKIEIAMSLIHETEMIDEQKAYLLKVLHETENVRNMRNEFTHNLIGYAGTINSGLHSYSTKARGKPVKTTMAMVTTEKAKQVADDIGGICFKLVSVVIGDKPWCHDTTADKS